MSCLCEALKSSIQQDVGPSIFYSKEKSSSHQQDTHIYYIEEKRRNNKEKDVVPNRSLLPLY